MRTSFALAVIAVFLLIAGAAVLYSGFYNIAATEQHTAPVHWVLEVGMRRSVRHHARAVVVPPLGDPALVARGRALHDEHCVACHGAPGRAPESFALGMTPPPANLAHTAREWAPAELFWVVKHGIKMTGMPGWEFRLGDDELWAIIAYLQHLPRQSPQQYRASAPVKAPSSEPAPATYTPDAARGRIAIQQYACATCHVIPGIVAASASVGPPLTGIASRSVIAGMVPNTVDNMIRWLQAPQAMHREGAMPNLGVTDRDARDIAAYLDTLR